MRDHENMTDEIGKDATDLNTGHPKSKDRVISRRMEMT
jgi:hypothetical protein